MDVEEDKKRWAGAQMTFMSHITFAVIQVISTAISEYSFQEV